MAKVVTKKDDIVAIANAVRRKSGISKEMTMAEIAENIDSIKTDPVLQSKTVTPKTTSQTITADSGYDGLSKVTINGDSDLVSGNIKKGINIFGVSGTMQEGENLDAAISAQDSLISQIKTALQGKAAGGAVETVTLTYSSMPAPGVTLHYIDGNLTTQTAMLFRNTEYQVLKNSILFVYGDGYNGMFAGTTFILGVAGGYGAFVVTG